MSSGDTRVLIEQAVTRLGDEVPALRQLKLVIRLELKARHDAPIWRVEVPGPRVTKDPAADARVDVSVLRPQFNALATDGHLRDWVREYELGHVKVNGDGGIIKLLGSLIQRQQARAR